MHPIEQLRFVARAGGADARLLVEEAASALTVFRHDHRALVMACRRLVDRQPTVAPLWWLCSRLVTTSDVAAEARSVVLELNNDPTSGSLAAYVDAVAGSMEAEARASSGRIPTLRIAIAGWPDAVTSGIVDMAHRTSSVEIAVVVVDVDGQGRALVHHLERVDVEAEDVDQARMSAVARSADLAVVEAVATNGRRLTTDVASAALMTAARDAGTPVCCVVPAGRALPDEFWEVVASTGGSGREPWSSSIEDRSMSLVDTVIAGDLTLARCSGGDSWEESVARALTPTWPVALELLR